MTELAPGDFAPDFTLPSSGAGTVSLSSLRGKRVILYFYPKDDTPGCTREACGFRDAQSEVNASDAVVLGVSPDSQKSHDRFVQKYGLSFPLLADTDHSVAEAYGAWIEKKYLGKRYMGIDRSTFLIGTDGRIERVWRHVKVDNHVQQVLTALNHGERLNA